MKTKLMIVALAAMILGACATASNQPLTPSEVAGLACPQINNAVTQLTAFNEVLIVNPATAAFGTKANADLAAVEPAINAVCNGPLAATGVSTASIQAFVQTGLPALGKIVGTLPLPAPQEAQIQGYLVLAETAAGVVGVVEQQIQVAKVSAAPAPASSAAK